MLGVVADGQARAELALGLDELLREGARRVLAVALEAEVDASVAACAEARDERGHRLVRRNGHAQPASLRREPGRSRSSARVDDRRVDPPPASGRGSAA